VSDLDANRQAALTGLYYYGEARYRKDELTPPAKLPPRLKVATPAEALSSLERDRRPGYQSAVRLAIAEMVSAHDAFPTFSDDVERLAATLSVDRVEVDRILKLPGLITGGAPVARAKRYFEAYELAGGSGCHVRNFRLDASYQDHVSNVTASIEVNRPVSDFVNGLDPRNWHETMPTVWAQSFEFDLASLPLDRKQTPSPTMPPSTPPFESAFFEKALWSIDFATLASWRTVLDITLTRALSAVPAPYIRFDYALDECLENEFAGVKNPGGIDVDHGHGSCDGLTTDPTWCKLEAQKVVRFTQPDLAINDVNFVSLIVWFSDLILTAACAPSS
jgi:hypothetical protein